MRANAAVVAGAAALAFLVGACGSAGRPAAAPAGPAVTTTSGPSTTVAPSGPAAALTGAYTSSVAAGSADVAFALHEDVAGQQLTGTGTGAVDFAAGSGTLDLTLSLPGEQTIALNEVVTGNTDYIEVPASIASALGTTSPWVSVPVGNSNALSSNPSQVLTLLLKDANSVTEVGPATIGGVPTTEYRAVVDPTRADAQLPAKLRAIASRAVSAAGLTSIPIEVYLDRQGRAVRVTEALSLPLPDPATGSAASPTPASPAPDSVTLQIDFTHYGTPVTVTPPPASEVGTSPQISSIFGGGASSPSSPDGG